MSVVNKMLKDLEQRQTAHNVSANYVPSKRPLKFYIIVALFSILFIAMAFSFYVVSHQQADTQYIVAAPRVNNKDVLPQSDSVATERDKKSPEDNFSPSKPPLPNSSQFEDNRVVAIETVSIQSEPIQPEPIQPEPIQPEPTNEVNKAPVSSRFEMKKSASTTQTLEQLKEQLAQATQDGDDNKVRFVLESMLANNPHNVLARKKLASLYYSQGELVQAELGLQQGIALSPNNSSLRLMLARLWYNNSLHAKALLLLSEHPALVPIDNELLSFRAALAEQQGQYLLAISDYEALIAREPNSARWWLGLAISQEKQRQPLLALASYEQATALGKLSTQVSDFIAQRVQVLNGRHL